MTNCGCSELENKDIVYSRNPPYVSKKSLQTYIDSRCGFCNEAIAYNAEPSYDDCCVDQIVTRDGKEVLRVDDPDNTSYVGAGGPETFFWWQAAGATQNLVANTGYLITYTSSGTVTMVNNDANVNLTANAIQFLHNGLYLVEMEYEFNSHTIAKNMNFVIYRNGVGMENAQTYYFSGANPTEGANTRVGKCSIVSYYTIGGSIISEIISGTSFTTNGLRNHVKIVRLSTYR